MFIPQVLHLLLSTISSLVKLSIRKQYNCLTSAQFSWIFSGLVGLDGWMTAAERYGDLQGLNKAETTNKYGEEKVGPGLYKKLFFFWSMLGCGKFSTLATLSVRRKLLKLLKKTGDSMAPFLCRSTSSNQGEIHYHETPGGGRWDVEGFMSKGDFGRWNLWRFCCCRDKDFKIF